MCHMYPDADKHVVEIQEAIADEVIAKVMEKHYEKPVPRPDRVTHNGLVFIVHYPVDIRSGSLAGEKIIRELRSLGFVGIEFFDGPSRDAGLTAIECTLSTVAFYEEYWAQVDKDEEVRRKNV
ncbi:hypothetical protein D3C81_523600 [compost metagenome]